MTKHHTHKKGSISYGGGSKYAQKQQAKGQPQLWEDDTEWVDGPVAEPEDKGPPMALDFTAPPPKKAETNTYQRCYHTHPALPIPGTDLVIYGGSCITPVVDDADIYVGFDAGQKIQRAMPWNNVREFHLHIPDMGVPKSKDDFDAMVIHVASYLKAGKKVHCGCIGGHGRTGMFFAALVQKMAPDTEDAIGYVRKHYCQKAVESQTQVDWLHKHFGVKKAAPAKTSYTSTGSTKSSTKFSYGTYTGPKDTGDIEINCIVGSGCLWK